MSHSTTELFEEYLDDQLDPRARGEFEAHLAACAECQRELNARRNVFLALDALHPTPLPVDLTPRVLAQIARNRARWVWGSALLAGQIALAVGLLVLFAPMLTNWFAPYSDALSLNPLANVGAPWTEFQNIFINPTQLVNEVLTQLSNTFDPNRYVSLAQTQWALLLAAISMVWLISNRLLLMNLQGERRAEQEVT